MSEIEGHGSWLSTASEHLQQAAEDADRSTELLSLSLRAIVEGAPVAGTALIRPYPNDTTKRWQVEYVGAKARGMRLWIPKQLEDSLESTTLSLRRRSPHFPEVDPEVLELNPPSAPHGGLWILWPYTTDVLKNSFGVEHEAFRRTLEWLLDTDGVLGQRLESLLEVEYLEKTFLRDSMPMVGRAIRRKEDQALHALLTLARQISGADFTYWGIVRDGFVIVKDYNFGTESEGFEFELPVGKGLGGIAFARMEPQMTSDYMNSGYRYPGVADAEDRENIRSAIAIPVRSSTSTSVASAPGSGGVLYAVRRTVAPFSGAQRALLVRLRKSIEPIPDSWPPLTGSFIPTKKSEYRRIQENPTNIGEVESFVEEIIEGPTIAVDGTGYPYTHSKVEKLNDLLHPQTNDRLRVVPIPGSRAEGERGQLYLWPRVELPLAWWPDLPEDAASLCRVVLHRIEPDQEYTRRRRSRWIERLLDRQTTPEKSEAKRLHLQTDRGEVWVVMWEKGPLEGPVETRPDERQPKRKELKKRRAEDVVWDELDVPLTFIDDNVWIMLLKGEGHENSPGAFRDKLLNYFREDLRPDSALWVVHGAYYGSLGDLRGSLEQTLKAAQDARRERAERYVLEIHSQGLDSLLNNHRISDDLNAFANKVLEALVDHDRKSGEQLTKTLCYALTRGAIKDKLGSAAEEAAVPLFVHANTVRNRVKRAEAILGRDLCLQEEKVILGLAAFVWLRRQTKGSEPGSI